MSPAACLVCSLLLVLGACTMAPGQEVRDATLVLQGKVFDSATGEVIEPGVVVLAGETIGCAGSHGDCRWPEGTPVRIVDEATILPGLIDLHVHARAHYLGAFVPSGITTIRDANNTMAEVERLRAADRHPRIAASGPLLDAPGSVIGRRSTTDGFLAEQPFEEIMPIYVANPEDAAEAVEKLAGAGVDLVKLYALLDPETFEAAVRAARSHDLPVAVDLGMVFTQGLSGATVDIVQAARAGVTTIEHLSGLSLAYQRRGGDPMADEVDEEILDEIAGELAATDVSVVPTMANMVQFSAPGTLPPEGLPGADRLSPYFEAHWNGLLGWAEQAHDSFAAGFRLKQALLERLREKGVRIGAGSDLPAAPDMLPGSALHQELQALVRSGLSPAEALQAATAQAAYILGREDLGYLRAGARADLLVVEGDPTLDILATRKVRAVWFAGEEVDLPAAWEAVEAQLKTVNAAPAR